LTLRLPEPRFIAFGEAAVLVEAAGPFDAQRIDATLRQAAPAWLRGTVPGLASVVVEFDPLTIEPDAVADALTSQLTSRHRAERSFGRDRVIPVVYGGEHGPDLDEVAGLLGRSPTDVIAQHAAATLSVLFLGFAPGFAYLGDLPGGLHVPRMPTPLVSPDRCRACIRRSFPAGGE
jgi:5-oxoprolinase (ATP-hydrolysing) subunit B